jgi:riboflavin biosynthesis pyrimidine reductase
MPRKVYADIGWTIDDVIDNSKQFGIRITKIDAKKVLKLEERHIADAMVEAGWNIIEDALLRR